MINNCLCKRDANIKLNYKTINGTLCAKITSKSVCKNWQDVKKGAKHLGKVIDK